MAFRVFWIQLNMTNCRGMLSGRWKEHAIMSLWQQLVHRISCLTNSSAFLTSLIIWTMLVSENAYNNIELPIFTDFFRSKNCFASRLCEIKAQMMLVGITGKKTENLRDSKLMDVDHVEFREWIKTFQKASMSLTKTLPACFQLEKLSNLRSKTVEFSLLIILSWARISLLLCTLDDSRPSASVHSLHGLILITYKLLLAIYYILW